MERGMERGTICPNCRTVTCSCPAVGLEQLQEEVSAPISEEKSRFKAFDEEFDRQAPRYLGAAIGVGLLRYLDRDSGLVSRWLLLTFAVWWLCSKLLKGDNQRIVPALSVNLAHFLSFGFGLLYAGIVGLFEPLNVIDLLFYSAGIVWLVLRRSRGAILFLGLFQATSLAASIFDLASSASSVMTNTILLFHICWRSLALLLIGKLWLDLRKRPLRSDGIVGDQDHAALPGNNL